MIEQRGLPSSDTQSRHVHLFYSGDVAEVKQVAEIVMPAGFSMTVISESPLLKGCMLMPFIQVGEGERYFGIRSIQRFAQQELKRLNTETTPG